MDYTVRYVEGLAGAAEYGSSVAVMSEFRGGVVPAYLPAPPSASPSLNRILLEDGSGGFLENGDILVLE